MRELRLLLVSAACLAPAAHGACPGPQIEARLSGADRNGPPLEAGDLLDWTLLLVQHACIGGCSEVNVPLGPEQVAATVGQGGAYDDATRTIRWSSTTTPQLGSIVPEGATFTLSFSTQVVGTDAAARACTRASLQQNWFGDCYHDCISDDPGTPLLDSTCVPPPVPVMISDVAPCRASWLGGVRMVVEGSGFDASTTIGYRDGYPYWTVTAVTPTRLEAVMPMTNFNSINDIVVSSGHHFATAFDALLAVGDAVEPNSLRLTKARFGGVGLSFSATREVLIERSEERDFACAAIEQRGYLVFAASPPEAFDSPLWPSPLWFYRIPPEE